MTGLGYTASAALAVVTVGALELPVLRTGLFRRPAYWLSMLIVLGFQIPVDGWLIKRGSASFSNDDHQIIGFGFRSISRSKTSCSASLWSPAVLLLWERRRVRR